MKWWESGVRLAHDVVMTSEQTGAHPNTGPGPGINEPGASAAPEAKTSQPWLAPSTSSRGGTQGDEGPRDLIGELSRAIAGRRKAKTDLGV